MVYSHQLGLPPRAENLGIQQTFKIMVSSNGAPLVGALVFLVTTANDTGNQHVRSTIANNAGAASIAFSVNQETPLYVSAVAESGTWYGASKCFKTPILLECPPLKFSGPIEWWHRNVGINEYNPHRGADIKVGLVDSGVGPHPYLNHVEDLGSIIDGKHQGNGEDVSYHGTMMAGLIAALPTSPHHPAGIAPAVSLSSIRVYPRGAAGANLDDVAAAIEFLAVKAGVDLINLSLSSAQKCGRQEQAIDQARSAGTLCIAAAGNESQPPVRYPAALSHVVAVGASGFDVTGPVPETNAVFRPENADKIGTGDVYLSTISSFGKKLLCLAPGTAIASTVPSKSGQPLYASQVGSSDSVAITTGVLAASLADDKAYFKLDRNTGRADYAEQRLRNLCQSIELQQIYQGLGIPTLP